MLRRWPLRKNLALDLKFDLPLTLRKQLNLLSLPESYRCFLAVNGKSNFNLMPDFFLKATSSTFFIPMPITLGQLLKSFFLT